MTCQQISVFVENKAGRLAGILRALAGAGINIRALSLSDTSDFGILRIMVCDVGAACQVLAENGFTFGRTTVVAVEMGDDPGSLASILQLFAGSEINIEYMYAHSRQTLSRPIMIFRFDKTGDALAILHANHITILGPEQLCSCQGAGHNLT